MIHKKLYINFTFKVWILAALFFLSAIPNLYAEGSRDLYPPEVQGGRAYLRASTSPSIAFPFPTMATHYVYAEAGERIALASSAQTGSTNRIRLYGPNNSQINLSFSNGVGNIPNRAAELAGPRLPGQSSGSNRYAPIYHQVTQSGIYRIEFLGTSTNFNEDKRMSYVAANANWSQSKESHYLAAWDISVAKQSVSSWNWQKGRVYTTVVNLDNPSYGGTSGRDNSTFRPNSGFFGKFKVLTRDGYVYNVDNNGNQGISFTFMVNNRGFYEPGSPDVPLYKSISAPNDQYVRDRYHDPRLADSGAAVSQKIFYNLPDSNMPEHSIGAVPQGETWLRVVETSLDVDVITVEGVEGIRNQLGKKGAFIKFYNESGGDFFITIKSKPTSVISFPERKLHGTSVIGENKIHWDGKDGAGDLLPNGLADVEIELKLRGAEVHFPYIDMELNHNGIILELLSQDLNSVRSDKVFWDDTDIRAVISNPFGTMTSPRNASHEVIPNGVSSNTNGHLWGLDSNRTQGSFGDEQGMDTWTFIEGDAISTEFEVDVKHADLEIYSIFPSAPSISLGEEVTYFITAKNNGPSDVSGARFSFIVPKGFNAKDISFNTNDCGTEVQPLVYDKNTGTYSSLLELPDGCEIYYRITLDVEASTSIGQHEFTATILRPNDVTDPDATNQDLKVSPTDPFYECDNNGLAYACNNIKTSTIENRAVSLCYELVAGEHFTWSYSNSYSGTTVAETITQPGTNGGFVFDIYELDNSFNMEINGVVLSSYEIEFQSNGTPAPGINIEFVDGDQYETDTEGAIWQMTGTTENPLIRVNISPSGLVHMYGSKTSGGELYPLQFKQDVSPVNYFNTVPWNANSENIIVVTQNVVGATLMNGYGSGQNIIPCRTYSLEKDGVFNDENNDGLAQVGETITYTLRVDNVGDIDIYNLKVTDVILGGELNEIPIGDDNSDGILNKNEVWVYTVLYSITQGDIDNKGVYNIASVSGQNVLNEILDPEFSTDPTPLDINDPNYDPRRPNHTFVPLKGRTLVITNPNIYHKVRGN
ncbi:putative repeat protein (TIGR01451 family) [Oceanihabitans sediminis]|uniref:Uncharacterized protein n=1 Tax=Oceanihabitans sediminis TaxID=1812012 RepID=A0A368P4C8_9FLAO|nr:DUF11 domain-containing protein [Oceanihabitans sediminis]MDX1774889.1 DUF11 domain-containing protein [Oceanihabitans sediminis]RBP30982.1 putative repeat protein (TIGR01451 family) [Oceanihabitans sediminis]RCU56934.1 hypothetical protein DU428_11370 [Oceanihabitans sediminis]